MITLTKSINRIIAGLTAFAVIISLTACNFDTKTEEKKFDEYLKKQFVETVSTDSITLHYKLKNPEEYGIEKFEPTLGEINQAEFDKADKEIENEIKVLKSFKYEKLTEEQKLTYDIILSYLNISLASKGLSYYQSILSPLSGFQLNFPTTLSEYQFYNEQDIKDYITLLGKTGEYFDDIIAFEKEKSKQGIYMPDYTIDEIIKQCKEYTANTTDNVLMGTFEDRLALLTTISEESKQQYREQNSKAVLESVLPAYDKLVSELEKLKGTGNKNTGMSSLPKGSEYYEKVLIPLNTGSSKNMRQLVAMIEKNIDEQIMGLSMVVSKNDKIFDELEKTDTKLSDPKQILELLKKNINDSYPELKDVQYTVKDLHKSLESNGSLAFYMIPPIDDESTNSIYVNRGANYSSNIMLFTTLAHEGYPGHLYQNNYFNSTDPHPIRNLLDFSAYSEGWATYVEQDSYRYAEMNASEEILSLMQFDRIFSLAILSRADIGVNYEGWDKATLAEFLSGYGYSGEEAANSIYETVIGDPTAYMPYYVGYLEVMEIRNYAESKLGDKFVLKEFNKAVLDAGPAPFEIVKKEVEKALNIK